MRKCEICGNEEAMESAEDLVGASHLHLCETCQEDRKFHAPPDILE
ncbi:hypothetical protein [Peribacillus glennii]|nr:hypothetical protein [Peribacillus glennii]